MATAKKITAPTKIKVNTRVKFTSKAGVPMTGKLTAYETKSNGEWAAVNVAEPRQPALLRYVRPCQLALA